MIGSAISIAVCTSVFNSYVRPRVATFGFTSTDALVTLEQELTSLPLDTQHAVRRILAKAYNRQMLVLCASAAAQIPAGLLLWKKEQILI